MRRTTFLSSLPLCLLGGALISLPASSDSHGSASPLARRAGVQTPESQAALKPNDVLERLKQGNARFVKGTPKKRNHRLQVKATAGGQFPMAAIVSCMDSRTSSEIVFDQGLGDVFNLRVAGNVADEDVLGSLEYAAKVAGVKLIAVIGHSSCGAVKGAVDNVELGNLTGLLKRIAPAVDAAASSGPKGTSKDHEFVARVGEQNVRLAMKEIREKSPVLKELLDSGAVGLVGGMYDLETGKVTFYVD